MSLCVGLTGGIGCGKSTVARLFAQHGAAIIDTDEIAHRLTQPDGIAISTIRDAFGADYITAEGALDRARMRSLIFSDTQAKRRLELLLHPLILAQVRLQLHQHHACPYVILIVPLLPDAPEFRLLVERVLMIDCNEDNQVTRVMRRSGMSSQEVRTIIALQTPRDERLKMADDVIHNDGEMRELIEQVRVLHEQYSQSGNRN
ncbi:MAG TPA: dephospho-CoA kinase [Gallionella sp.]